MELRLWTSGGIMTYNFGWRPFTDGHCMLPTIFADIFWPGASWFVAGVLLGVTGGWLLARILSERALASHTKQIETLSIQARTDGLTGLANRRVLEDEFSRRLALWREQKTPLVLVLADVDHFKRINDEHGHAAGDAALKHLASVTTATLRQTDLVARYGGDEFAMLLAAKGAGEAAQALARLQRAIADAPPLFNGAPLPLTVSFGATSPEAELSSTEFFRRADAALRAAKNHGRDSAFWHDGKTQRHLTANSHSATPA
jgi:diguanylate cyclase (GGDEF)-like protein